MTRRLSMILPALCLLALTALAQQPGNEAALDADLFPPDLVMRFQRDIDLSEEQSAAILATVRDTQSQMIEVQWQLNPELQGMRELLAAERVDEAAVLERLARITALEVQAKELQILMMVRVKNQLTPEQQQRLRGLR